MSALGILLLVRLYGREVLVPQRFQTFGAAGERAITGRGNRVLGRQPGQELIDILRHRIVEHRDEIAHCAD